MPDRTTPAPSHQPSSDRPAPESGRGAAQTPASDDTPVSDDKVQPDGSGQQGRPTDDSDPGHS